MSIFRYRRADFAVRLLREVAPTEPPPVRPDLSGVRGRRCQRCQRPFFSAGPWHRVCDRCAVANSRIGMYAQPHHVDAEAMEAMA